MRLYRKNGAEPAVENDAEPADAFGVDVETEADVEAVVDNVSSGIAETVIGSYASFTFAKI